jgi:hypothetical protein
MASVAVEGEMSDREYGILDHVIRKQEGDGASNHAGRALTWRSAPSSESGRLRQMEIHVLPARGVTTIDVDQSLRRAARAIQKWEGFGLFVAVCLAPYRWRPPGCWRRWWWWVRAGGSVR